MVIDLIMSGESLTVSEQLETPTINKKKEIDLGEKIISLTRYVDVFDKKSPKKINRILKRKGIISEDLEDCYLCKLPTENEVVLPKRIIEFKRKINPILQKGSLQLKIDQTISFPNEYKDIKKRMEEEALDSENYLCLSSPKDELILVFMAEKKGTCLGRFNLI
jgi:hypothetical protein